MGHERMLTSDAMDMLIPLILKDALGRTEASTSSSIVVISSQNMQAVLSRYCFSKSADTQVTSENVYSLLGTTRAAVEGAKVVVMMVHGPRRERDRRTALRWGHPAENFHWSIACWFPGLGDAYHYDSHNRMNWDRCGEDIFGTLRKLGVLPETLDTFWMPSFFPQQTGEWECGYFALIALAIICQKVTPEPLTDHDTETTYAPWFETLDAGGDAAFRRRLLALVAREKYACP